MVGEKETLAQQEAKLAAEKQAKLAEVDELEKAETKDEGALTLLKEDVARLDTELAAAALRLGAIEGRIVQIADGPATGK